MIICFSAIWAAVKLGNVKFCLKIKKDFFPNEHPADYA